MNKSIKTSTKFMLIFPEFNSTEEFEKWIFSEEGVKLINKMYNVD